MHHDEAPWSGPLVLGWLTGTLAVVCSENVHLSKGRCLDRAHSTLRGKAGEGTLAHSPQVPESVGGLVPAELTLGL